MAMVTKTVDFTVPHSLTDEEKNMIEKAEAMPVTFDEDCLESTEEMLHNNRKWRENDYERRNWEAYKTTEKWS